MTSICSGSTAADSLKPKAGSSSSGRPNHARVPVEGDGPQQSPASVNSVTQASARAEIQKTPSASSGQSGKEGARQCAGGTTVAPAGGGELATSAMTSTTFARCTA